MLESYAAAASPSSALSHLIDRIKALISDSENIFIETSVLFRAIYKISRTTTQEGGGDRVPKRRRRRAERAPRRPGNEPIDDRMSQTNELKCRAVASATCSDGKCVAGRRGSTSAASHPSPLIGPFFLRRTFSLFEEAAPGTSMR
jgi:hypothetical protein